VIEAGLILMPTTIGILASSTASYALGLVVVILVMTIGLVAAILLPAPVGALLITEPARRLTSAKFCKLARY
jgi:hypothetical protein